MPNPVNQILHGDCLDVLKTLESNSIDAVVTDPPYGMGSKEPTAAEIDAYLAGANLDTGGDFMGKKWEIPPVRVWQECLRVLKPGGLLFAFASTRTWDIMQLGIEAAGFSDDTFAKRFGAPILQWVHGQGFPKSLNLSKAIDKVFRDINLPAVKLKRILEMRGPDASSIVDALCLNQDKIDDAAWEMVRQALNATVEEELTIETEILLSGKATLEALEEEVDEEGEEDALVDKNAPPYSELAKKWHGWGTALKPSWEPILVFAKPGAPAFEPAGLEASFCYAGKVSKAEATLKGLVENSHPTKKPLNLMRWLLKLAAAKGSLVLDPYCGSGSTCVAATEEGMLFIGIEKDEIFYKVATQRVGIVHEKEEHQRDIRAVFDFMSELPQE